MQPSMRGFLLGIFISTVVVVIFIAGGVSDRAFTLKPVSWLLRNSPQETAAPTQPTILNSDEKSTVEVSDNASASVVTISVKRPQTSRRIIVSPFSREVQPQTDEIEKVDIGTGFVITDDGLIATNKHVVDGQAEYFVIDKQNKEHKVLNIYRDPVNDLAILKVEGLEASKLEMGDSDQLKVGQQVIAIGTALGEFRHTVTTGVVSGLGRGIEASDPFGASVESLENVIQTDAAINPGNSGGPLLDSNGRVIGVNVAVSAAGQNIGFAIPINIIRASLDNFNQTGRFERPILGVRYQPISERAALANEVPQGAYVVEVIQDTAASTAGIQEGDIITTFDGKPLKDATIPSVMNTKKVGDKVKVKYWRDGEEKEVEVTLTLDEP